MRVGRKKLVPKEERSNYLPEKWYPKMYIPKAIRDEVMKRDGGQCQICGSEKNLQVRYRVPACRGGEMVVWNMVVMCRLCGNAKGLLTMEELVKTPYIRFEILGIDTLGEDPVLVKVVFTDGTILEGWAREDPEMGKGDYYVYLGKRGVKILLPREKVKAIVIIPKSAEPEYPKIAGYLEKISSLRGGKN